MSKTENVNELRCSFCGKAESEVKMLLSGPGVFICDECVKQCEQVIAGDFDTKDFGTPDDLPTPKEIKKFLDEYGCEVDYIHGEDVVKELSKKDSTIGFLLPKPEKSALFKTVIEDGALPRKTFSMGEANEKRYYMESRLIRE